MSDNRKDLPPITSPNFLEKVREALGVYLGNRGDALDRGVTLRDLTDSGMVTLRPGYGSGGGKFNPIGGAGPNAGGAYEIDLTPPPTPSGFTATAAISNLLVECGAPTYTQGHGHAKSVLYGATWTTGPLPVFANAVVITEFSGTVASHATNPSTTWHLWLKWVTVDGVYSTSPAGGTNGVVTRTGEDVSLLLTALTGEITASQLYADLGSRIDLIDGASGLAGSVNARVLAESTLREGADTAEAEARSLLQTSVAENLASALTSYSTTSTMDSAIASSVEVVQARLNTGDFSSVVAESSASADAVTGLKAQYTVKLDVDGKVSGFGLASSSTSSAFAIRADRFYIAAPSGTTGIGDTIPFTVQATATTIGGVAVPAGVYMADAYIKNGTITNAKIANLAVDDAKISALSAAKITTGFLDAARISAGSLDAKIANLDSAVITSGFINAARINTASIGNATISTAQIANATISTAQIANATIGAAQVTGLLTASQINATNLNVVNGSFSGALNVASGASGARMEIKNNVIKVFDTSGVLRVQIGDLSV